MNYFSYPYVVNKYEYEKKSYLLFGAAAFSPFGPISGSFHVLEKCPKPPHL
jgi:predicted small secreted protein